MDELTYRCQGDHCHRGEEDGTCEAYINFAGSWACNLPQGHPGPHIACYYGGPHNLVVWDEDDEVVFHDICDRENCELHYTCPATSDDLHCTRPRGHMGHHRCCEETYEHDDGVGGDIILVSHNQLIWQQ